MVVKIDKVIADGGERDQMSDFAKPLQSISTSNNTKKLQKCEVYLHWFS